MYTEHLSGKICAEVRCVLHGAFIRKNMCRGAFIDVQRVDVFYTEHLSGKICAEVRCVLHGAFIRKNMCRG